MWRARLKKRSSLTQAEPVFGLRFGTSLGRPTSMSQRVRLLITSVVVLCGSSSAAVESRPLPDPKTVHAVVAAALRKHTDYQIGDLITRTQITAAADAVAAQTGWRLNANQYEELVARGIEDRSFLARQLTSKEGRKFSRQISRYKLGFDQLDRMSSMPQGRSTVERLVHGPDGYKLLEYMATANGGRELAKMLSGTHRGGNFDAETGRIYDEMQLNAAFDRLLKQAGQTAVLKP